MNSQLFKSTCCYWRGDRIFGLATFHGKHVDEEKRIARPNRLHIGAERLKWSWELDAKFFQPQFGARRPGVYARYTCCALRPCIHVRLLSSDDADRSSRESPVELKLRLRPPAILGW